MRIDLQEFRPAYLAEVDEHLAGARRLLLEMDAARRQGRVPARELRELMRVLHTIKGLSSMVGVDAVVDLTHEMESLVRSADVAGATLGEAALEALIEGVRAIESRVASVTRDEPVAPAPPALLARLASARSASEASAPAPIGDHPELDARLGASERQQLASAAASGRRAVRVSFAPSPRKADAGITITTVRQRLERVGELVRVLPIATEQAPTGLLFAMYVVTDAPDDVLVSLMGGEPGDVTELGVRAPEPPAEPIEDEEPDARRAGFLRVEVGRIDDTIEKLSSLIVTRSRLEHAAATLAAAGADTRVLDGVVLDLRRQLRELRGALLSVRMMRLSLVLDRLGLVVRGLSRTCGKEVRLHVDVGSTELDKTVAERLFPALVHVVRNAVDHGIETPEVRRAAGKPEYGTITISAESKGERSVEIRVRDDGAGVDGARVAAQADAEVPQTPGALLDLLTRAGLSTRSVADHASGRGLGLDIVRRVVEGLGGELALETTPGHGTTFVLRVPLTIAVIDAFTVACAGRRFAVPVPAVAEIVEVSPETLPPTPGTTGVKLLARRGESLALVELASMLGLTRSEATGAARHAVVVRRSEQEAVAFAIDRVLGQQEAVVRPLSDPLVAVNGVSGSTDLGDGQPTLVLDLVALLDAPRETGAAR